MSEEEDVVDMDLGSDEEADETPEVRPLARSRLLVDRPLSLASCRSAVVGKRPTNKSSKSKTSLFAATG